MYYLLVYACAEFSSISVNCTNFISSIYIYLDEAYPNFDHWYSENINAKICTQKMWTQRLSHNQKITVHKGKSRVNMVKTQLSTTKCKLVKERVKRIYFIIQKTLGLKNCSIYEHI